MDSASAQLVSTIGRSDAERAARAVRAPRTSSARRASRSTGPADHRVGRGAVRRRAHRRRQLASASTSTRGSRRSSTTSAWIRGTHALQGRRRRAVDWRRRASAASCSSTPSRRSPTTWRPRAARTRSATRTSSSCSATRRATTTPAFYGFFVQDDWQVTPRAEAALRHALRRVRRARRRGRSRPNPLLAGLHDRQEQLRAARRAVSWAVDEQARTVVRASTGLMYEPPLLDFYDNAILSNGDPKSFNVGPLAPTAAGAPAFPASLANLPPGFVLPQAEHHRGRSGLQDPVGAGSATSRSSARSTTTSRCRSATSTRSAATCRC